ncbi:hypothetical protein N7509_008030 [Penicillium cosmopolitanum]|uniref:Uncharacterized protein n=1 Tax=Penicillium cosmopolitanum TaxID=1131564 RepID=A0A9X0B8X6_9EURO|nr:uncharacterized protein N7509_008030 [Penicillium cosmopolitanum]KAJ5392540.1 hypothetical protein N7509_008030 [Penicillium cosmopolitanum]
MACPVHNSESTKAGASTPGYLKSTISSRNKDIRNDPQGPEIRQRCNCDIRAAAAGVSSSQVTPQGAPSQRKRAQRQEPRETQPEDNPPPYVEVETQIQSTPSPNRSDPGPATDIGSPSPPFTPEENLGLDNGGSKQGITSAGSSDGPHPDSIEETGLFLPKASHTSSSPPPPELSEDESPLFNSRGSVSDAESTRSSIPSTSDSRKATEQWIYDPARDSLMYRRRAKEPENRQRELTDPVDPALLLDKPKYVLTGFDA